MDAQSIVASVLRALIALSFLAFGWAAFGGSTLWWLNKAPWNSIKPRIFTIKYYALIDRQPPTLSASPPPNPKALALMPSYFSLKLFVLFTSTVVAAVATLCLRSLTENRRNAHSPLWTKAKTLLQVQLPPRKFFLWLCGGVNILDATVVLGVLALALVWIQQLTALRWNAIEVALQKGTFAKSYPNMTVRHAKLDMLARRCGFGGLAGLLVLFYSVPRNSFLQALFRTDFSHIVKYHRWLGHMTLLLISVHGVLNNVSWGIQGQWRDQITQWSRTNIPHLAGLIAWLFAIVLWCTSFQFIRRHYFEVFYRAHILCFSGFIIMAFIHVNQVFYYAIPGFILYLLDLTFRLAQWMNVSIVTGNLLADRVLSLQLSFSPDTKLLPNSFCFVGIPAASRMQWHPFTLAYVRNSSSPSQPALALLYVKPYGRWGQAVAKQIAQHGSVIAKVDGPYGGCSSPLLEHACQSQRTVIFAGGIGVTPMLGLLDALCTRNAQHGEGAEGKEGERHPKCTFVWVCRNPEEFQLLNESLLAESRRLDGWLDMRLYCTAEGPHRPVAGPEKHEQARDAVLKLSEGDSMPMQPHGLQKHDITMAGQARWSCSSPFFVKPGLLQGYGISYPVWALCHVLAFAGSFFAILLVEAYNAVGLLWTNVTHGGFSWWLVGFMRLVTTFVGGMGFPALIIFPMYWYRRHMAARQCSQLHSTHMNDTCQDTQCENGSRLHFIQGRPDFQEILAEAHADSKAANVMHVSVAGPAGMVQDVKQACTFLNMKLSGGPFLSCSVDSFAL